MNREEQEQAFQTCLLAVKMFEVARQEPGYTPLMALNSAMRMVTALIVIEGYNKTEIFDHMNHLCNVALAGLTDLQGETH